MKREASGVERVFDVADDLHLARQLQRYVGAAKLERASLLVAEETSRRLVFHDLRGTGITWHAVAGTEPLKIQQWAGHTDFQTTQGYLVTADAVGRDGFGEPFPALPKSLFSGESFWHSPLSSMISVEAPGIEPCCTKSRRAGRSAVGPMSGAVLRAKPGAEVDTTATNSNRDGDPARVRRVHCRALPVPRDR